MNSVNLSVQPDVEQPREIGVGNEPVLFAFMTYQAGHICAYPGRAGKGMMKA
jgi:hypothetical protein